MIASIIATIVGLTLAAWASWRAHARAVDAAAERGRREERERQAAIREGVRLTVEAGERALLEAGKASGAAAELTSSEPVVNAEVERWAAPPKGES